MGLIFYYFNDTIHLRKLLANAPPANNNNVGGHDVRNVPAVEMRFEDMENYMVEKAKKKSLELA